MDKVDGFLSQRAQNRWPGALVKIVQGNTNTPIWILARPGADPVELGEHFKAARMALQAMINADKQEKGWSPTASGD